MKAVELGVGAKCHRCQRTMKRYGHRPEWKPSHSQPYYFRYWDKCKCGMLQHYESAKVNLTPLDDLEREYRDIMGA